MGKKRDKDPAKDSKTSRGRESAVDAVDAPGAGSGKEDLAHERVVRGSAGGAQGYSAKHGTLAGNPIEGLETTRPERSEDDR